MHIYLKARSEWQSKIFSTACRESDHDRLLDLVFTLEVLFGNGDADSIKHRILIRLINLISSNKDVRESLYEKKSALYDTRSKSTG